MKKKSIKIFLSVIFVTILVLMSTNVYAEDDIIVILDPGHGGNDSGAIAGGIYEKDVTWKIAKRVKEIFDGTPGITGILARGKDNNPSLYERGLLAKNSGADLLVSFHINSSSNTSAYGSEVYITDDPHSPRFYEASNYLGKSVLDNLRGVGIVPRSYRPLFRKSTDGELYSDGFLSDYYGIIRNPMYYGIPGVLIEHCFISNWGDRNSFLSSDSQLNRLAEADARAIIANKERFRINRENNSMNSQITKLSVNSAKTHLTGEVIVVDWINDMQAVPKSNPTIKLVSTDGETIYCYVQHKGGNTYYFDTWLSNIDSSKEYKIEISAADRVNIPVHHTMYTPLGNDKFLGEDELYNYLIKNQVLVSETKQYVGDLNSEIQKLNTIKVSENKYYITGEIIAVEWINGKSNVPRQTPAIYLKSNSGDSRKLYIKRLTGNTYYFDGSLEGLDMTKQYYLEIISENPNNLSTSKNQIVNLAKLQKVIGRCQDDKQLEIQEGKIIFNDYTYIGNINSQLVKFNVGKANNATYVSGEIIVVEWVNGLSTVPEVAPTMRFKSVDGSVNIDVFVTATGTNTYYFDRYIEGIDISKEYYFEIESGSKSNISSSKIMNVKFDGTEYNNKIVGKYHDKNIKLSEQKIMFKDDTYVGNINSGLVKFNVGKANEATYVSGEIIIVEWVDGLSTVPEVAPKMRFKCVDDPSINLEVFVTTTGTNTYYFDRYIEGIDTTKEYYFEVESGDTKNISESKSMNVYFRGTDYNNTIVGKYHDYNIRLSEQKIIFEK